MADNHFLSRRSFFSRASQGVYGAALAYLLNRDVYGGSGLLAGAAGEKEPEGQRRVYDLKPRRPHFEPKAKAVIQLFMNGGPSQMDLFDPKPLLEKHHGKQYFSKINPADIQDVENAGALLRSPFRFAQHGQSGIWLSEVLPYLAQEVDQIAVIRSMVTSSPSHDQACWKMLAGRTLPGLPTLGAWVTYGLGSENQNLPAFVVLEDPLGLPVNGIFNWQSGFLPPVYQGTRMRSTGSPLLNLQPEAQRPPEVVMLERELLRRLDLIHKRERPAQLQLDARIASYELAARLQLDASDALDISRESQETLEMYGVGEKPVHLGRLHPMDGKDSYARRCIMARRLVERGVRFVQVCVNTQIWDTHAHLENDLRAACEKTDKPVAALLKDLKRRGMLDSTLVLWGGEFGRLPLAQIQPAVKVEGRDHNPRGFTVWMAGGGVKGGTVYGATDDIGYEAVENPVSVADWHATILHLLGLHHEQLFFERNGFQEKLTFTYPARITREILA
ncbi:MAG: DUF1501 domain-containing protein [Acidobacteria bacterium]|nr:DUF1501 domain-containing protein [Acidobacteriota bacterium]